MPLEFDLGDLIDDLVRVAGRLDHSQTRLRALRARLQRGDSTGDSTGAGTGAGSDAWVQDPAALDDEIAHLVGVQSDVRALVLKICLAPATVGPHDAVPAPPGVAVPLTADTLGTTAASHLATAIPTAAPEGDGALPGNPDKEREGPVQETGEQATASFGDEIDAIAAAIDDIDARTNLLALTTAVEAARAGERAKDPGAVLAEVRFLAQRTGAEMAEIGRRLVVIQGRMATVRAAFGAVDGTGRPRRLLGERAGSALRDILGMVEETARQARQFAAAIEHITAGNAAAIATAPRDQTETTREMVAGAQTMAGLASAVQAMVGRFILDHMAAPTGSYTPWGERRARQARGATGNVILRRRVGDWELHSGGARRPGTE